MTHSSTKGGLTSTLDLQAPSPRLQRDPKVKENALTENQKENRPRGRAGAPGVEERRVGRGGGCQTRKSAGAGRWEELGWGDLSGCYAAVYVCIHVYEMHVDLMHNSIACILAFSTGSRGGALAVCLHCET